MFSLALICNNWICFSLITNMFILLLFRILLLLSVVDISSIRTDSQFIDSNIDYQQPSVYLLCLGINWYSWSELSAVIIAIIS